jgi:hypothetical protein
MIERCENPAHISYPRYGPRGIKVCDRWHDFDAFLADVGFPPSPGLQIDRIDNDGDYEPGNVRWATAQEQRLNQRPRASYWPRLAECGTESAYARHLRYQEEPCDECRAAHAAQARRKNVRVTCLLCGSEFGVVYLRTHLRNLHPEVAA